MEPMVIVPPSLLNVVSLVSTSSDGTGFIGTKLHVRSTGMLMMSSKSGTAISMVIWLAHMGSSEGARVGTVVGGTYGKLDFDTLGVKDVGAWDGAGGAHHPLGAPAAGGQREGEGFDALYPSRLTPTATSITALRIDSIPSTNCATAMALIGAMYENGSRSKCRQKENGMRQPNVVPVGVLYPDSAGLLAS